MINFLKVYFFPKKICITNIYKIRFDQGAGPCSGTYLRSSPFPYLKFNACTMGKMFFVGEYSNLHNNWIQGNNHKFLTGKTAALLPPCAVCLTFLQCMPKNQEIIFIIFLKVSRSWNKIVVPYLFLENNRPNLFFYPDHSEVVETWILIQVLRISGSSG